MLVDEVRQSVNNVLADMLHKQNSHLKTNIDHVCILLPHAIACLLWRSCSKNNQICLKN